LEIASYGGRGMSLDKLIDDIKELTKTPKETCPHYDYGKSADKSLGAYCTLKKVCVEPEDCARCDYGKMRGEVMSWPQWKKDTYNENFAVSKHAIKLHSAVFFNGIKLPKIYKTRYKRKLQAHNIKGKGVTTMTEKNKGGRPLKYTQEELKERIDRYFEDESHKPYSILEICSELGISKETWNEWERNEDKGFSDLIKGAKNKVAAGWEKGSVNPALSIFLLKNHMHYVDKQEIESHNINEDLNGLTPEERQKRIAELIEK
jgi:hypothetical protein